MFNIQPGQGLGFTAGKEIACGLGTPFIIIVLPPDWVERRQQVFIVILKVNGCNDYELPVSTIMMRIRDVLGSYVRVTVPNPTAYTDEILERIDGSMHIMSGYQTEDGVRDLDEIIYANIQNLYYDEGSNNVLTLTGTRYITHSNPQEKELVMAQFSKDESGRCKGRSTHDWSVKPNDIITTMGETFTLDLVTHIITPFNIYMDMEGE